MKMIDLHCHLLPGVDDGAADLDVSLEMARIAVADGIGTVACTPHIFPGVYENTGDAIRQMARALQAALENAEIPLSLTYGADAHLDPQLLSGLRSGKVPSIGGTRYFLLEPPHHFPPPRLREFVFNALTQGYIPVLTHPERLAWIEDRFDLIREIAEGGAIIQITAASVTGQFGSRPKYWSERLLDEEMVGLLASDGHDTRRRPPKLAAARDAVAKRCGDATAIDVVATNPLAILRNVIVSPLRH